MPEEVASLELSPRKASKGSAKAYNARFYKEPVTSENLAKCQLSPLIEQVVLAEEVEVNSTKEAATDLTMMVPNKEMLRKALDEKKQVKLVGENGASKKWRCLMKSSELPFRNVDLIISEEVVTPDLPSTQERYEKAAPIEVHGTLESSIHINALLCQTQIFEKQNEKKTTKFAASKKQLEDLTFQAKAEEEVVLLGAKLADAMKRCSELEAEVKAKDNTIGELKKQPVGSYVDGYEELREQDKIKYHQDKFSELDFDSFEPSLSEEAKEVAEGATTKELKVMPSCL
ncbi:unnamed protein product [Ilex paraguariensis]|uniref:Uncharacterized protein n=1 Tax=Ilex paraguariensis TaxID=185542 RepID=A0ABC8QR66_9AQUA